MKETYLNNEIWTLTFGAAFQRANVYEKSATDDSKIVDEKYWAQLVGRSHKIRK
jgi:hypothetical protein